jgi:hypothetical protein
VSGGVGRKGEDGVVWSHHLTLRVVCIFSDGRRCRASSPLISVTSNLVSQHEVQQLSGLSNLAY